MPRPKKRRRVRFSPRVAYFKPAGVPLRNLQEVVLAYDEVEALRLKELKGLDQNMAAEKMNLSQSSFQRILANARKKLAEAVIRGKAIKINKDSWLKKDNLL